MKRRLIYSETSYDVYLYSIAKKESVKTDLSCIVYYLYKNLTLEMFKDTDLLFTMHRRTKNV